METDINLNLRSEILDIALNLEQDVNTLLLTLLSIENQQRKAITNKSGNLTFKNKIDLLFDLDVLNSKEHKQFLLLMEFRNQFLHNIECGSFEIAVDLLGADRGRKLLKFDDADKIQDIEFRYTNSFRRLNIKCLKIISKKINDRGNQIEDRRKTHVKLLESQIFFIDKYFDLLKTIALICENNISETPDVNHLISHLSKIVKDEMESALSSDEFIQLQNKLDELHTPEKIKAYYKR